MRVVSWDVKKRKIRLSPLKAWILMLHRESRVAFPLLPGMEQRYLCFLLEGAVHSRRAAHSMSGIWEVGSGSLLIHWDCGYCWSAKFVSMGQQPCMFPLWHNCVGCDPAQSEFTSFHFPILNSTMLSEIFFLLDRIHCHHSHNNFICWGEDGRGEEWVRKREKRPACLMLKKSLFVLNTLEKLFKNSSSVWKTQPLLGCQIQ